MHAIHMVLVMLVPARVALRAAPRARGPTSASIEHGVHPVFRASGRKPLFLAVGRDVG